MTPPAPPWTPERLAEMKALCENVTETLLQAHQRIVDRSYALPDALVEIERLTAQWEALKAYCKRFYNATGDEVAAEMARLEREPPQAREEGEPAP